MKRLFGRFDYKANTWDKKRKVIAKAEHSDRSANPRYVATNLEGEARELYCARGEMENRIKEQQLGLSVIEPVVTPGGPISSACYCLPRHMCFLKRCAASA
jgi:DDE family transposase